VDKSENPKGTLRSYLKFVDDEWLKETYLKRATKFFSISRTVPPTESPLFALRKKLRTSYKQQEQVSISTKRIEDIDPIKNEAERILGKSLADFQLFEVELNRFAVV
jgi:DNA repair photolyase